jgi:hypothetical protein
MMVCSEFYCKLLELGEYRRCVSSCGRSITNHRYISLATFALQCTAEHKRTSDERGMDLLTAPAPPRSLVLVWTKPRNYTLHKGISENHIADENKVSSGSNTTWLLLIVDPIVEEVFS